MCNVRLAVVALLAILVSKGYLNDEEFEKVYDLLDKVH